MPQWLYSWLQTRDWQAVEGVGTWASMIAFVILAALAWRVAKGQKELAHREFKAVYEPDIVVHPRTWQPEVGVLQKPDASQGEYHFSGIAWDLTLFNPGQSIIAVRSVDAWLQSTHFKNRRVFIGRRPTRGEFFKGETAETETTPDIDIMVCDDRFRVAGEATFPLYILPMSQSGQPIRLGLWVLGRSGSLATVINDISKEYLERSFKLELSVGYECVATSPPTRKEAKIESFLVFVPKNIQFGFAIRKR